MPTDPCSTPSFSIMSLGPETMLEIFDLLFTYAEKPYNSTAYTPQPLPLCYRLFIPLNYSIPQSVMTVYLNVVSLQKVVNVHIAYVNKGEAVEACKENARFDILMNCLGAHLRRCRTISIHTRYHSSILVATKRLDTLVLPQLFELSLVSYVTDTIADAGFTALECPSIASLSVDAQTLVNLVGCLKKLPNPEKELDKIHVTRYCPHNGTSRLSPSSLISAISQLMHGHEGIFLLCIDNVTFGETSVWYSGPDLGIISYIQISDQDTEFLHPFFSALDPPWEAEDAGSVTLTRCTLLYPVEICLTPEIMLREIGDSDSILNVLRGWDGFTPSLRLDDCSGLDDDVLETLVDEDLCPNTSRFDIHGCPGLSVDALQSFASSRVDGGRFEELHVSGGPVLSEEEKQWF
ncbi:hypothetical protein CONPUDRAFT_150537 [Coniophora puteana RWD-64-598 SS2]|uniref:F-box domain-containing protein n=1 Tax=Coniophora puteana (strain RWD-64-598) TaxID=741705 RepID=A0A5M3N360_CONPW|nr:uncharacterized protein CONPUDRAFT_150537 [Coniophora puteana RWD-64-598 SS2]EIW85756.1 hypothetical protein CONPUDRAFT_150537 [Coniophora puteana RWD-64-598 SS2]